MEAAPAARITFDHRPQAPAVSPSLLQQIDAQARTVQARKWTLDDDYGCGQRNSPPPPDWALIGAVVDLEN